MGVFDDKKFDELDWISQATEPIDSRLNEVLAKIPDIINIDFETYVKLSSGTELSIPLIVSSITSDTQHVYLSWEENTVLTKMFTFELEGSPIIDFNQKVIRDGSLKLVKLAGTIDEKTMMSFLGKEGLANLWQINFGSDGSLSRANEVMELLEKCQDGIMSKSSRRKVNAIKNRLETIFKTDEWRIRDTELANKISYWIKNYIAEGDIAAYSNFCKLKVMTHKQQAIYSVEEVT